jgi:hypothetical protein
MKEYTPRPGTSAYAALQYFQAHSDEELSSQQLAALVGVDVKKIPALISNMERSQLLAKRKMGNGYVWSLGARRIDALPEPEVSEATDDAEVQDDAFSFALWNDGELMINGAMQTETGIQLTVQQTAQLVAYLTSTAAYVEYLGQQAPT